MIELRPGEANCGLCRRGPKCSFWGEATLAKRQAAERHDCSFFVSITPKQLDRRFAAEVDQESLF